MIGIHRTLLSTAAAVASAALLCACSRAEKSSDLGTIDIASAIANPEQLKVSDLGSKIAYIPLETNDSSLIGNKFYLRANDDAVFVVGMDQWGMAPKYCKAFSLDSGSFIAALGHPGQDPQAWSSPMPGISNDKTAYFCRFYGSGCSAQKYSVTGEYLGQINPGVFSAWGYSAVADTTVMTVQSALLNDTFGMILISGGLNSIPDTTTISPMPANENIVWQDVTISTVRGVMLNSQISFMEYATKTSTTYQSSNPSYLMWQTGGDLRFKPAFVDTLYSVTPRGMEKAYTFNTGANGIDYRTLNSKGIGSDNLVLCEVIETPDKIIFGASVGWMNYEHKSFMGFFDKATGETKATEATNRNEPYKGFVDDIEDFIPFNPIISTPRGELIGLLTIENIMKWLEENPGKELPESLRDLPDDANPILVVVSK